MALSGDGDPSFSAFFLAASVIFHDESDEAPMSESSILANGRAGRILLGDACGVLGNFVEAATDWVSVLGQPAKAHERGQGPGARAATFRVP